MMSDFKAFAMRGNVVDMAVGVVIGGAFGKIIASLVADVITPILGILVGGVKFTNIFYALDGNDYATLEAAKAAGAATLNIGIFMQAVFDFLIIAFSIFMVIRAMTRLQKKQEAAPAAPPEPTKEETLLTEIRDLLAKRS
ncbi:MAG: large-conductance mechanosensitive channel protein MscL [Myxococcota bacterium]